MTESLASCAVNTQLQRDDAQLVEIIAARLALHCPGPSIEARRREVRIALFAALRRVRSWHHPPQWSAADWRDEITQVAREALWQAALKFDARYNVPFGAFAVRQVRAIVWTLYRQEQRWGRRNEPAAASAKPAHLSTEPSTA